MISWCNEPKYNRRKVEMGGSLNQTKISHHMAWNSDLHYTWMFIKMFGWCVLFVLINEADLADGLVKVNHVHKQ